MKISFHHFLTAGIFLLAACGKPDPKARLEDLKKQQSELRREIMLLEEELAKTGAQEGSGTRDVAVTVIEAKPFEHLIEIQGRVESDENVLVSPEMMGTVSRVHVKVGDKVTKGTLLAELEGSVFQKSLEELQGAREFANTLYLKQKSLWDQKIGTEIQYLQAKNNLESLDKKIATVRQQLEMTRIKSPINGTVDAVDIKTGQSFAPGMPGLRVVNFSKLKIHADVAEAYINKIKKGDPAGIYIPDNGERIKASITYTGKVIDPLNRTFRVEVNMSGKEAMLNPNQVAVLSITDYRSDNAISLPLSVIQNTPEGSYVFVAEGKKAVRRNITTGQNYRGQTEILSGLKAGEKVVTGGYEELTDGQAVNY